eukprot:3985459-Lingulodinium_polyedra.AAC.1
MTAQIHELDAALEDLDSQKRQRVMTSLERLLEVSIGKAVAASDERWDTRMPQLLEGIDKRIHAAVSESEKRTTNKFAALQAQ